MAVCSTHDEYYKFLKVRIVFFQLGTSSMIGTLTGQGVAEEEEVKNTIAIFHQQ